MITFVVSSIVVFSIFSNFDGFQVLALFSCINYPTISRTSSIMSLNVAKAPGNDYFLTRELLVALLVLLFTVGE